MNISGARLVTPDKVRALIASRLPSEVLDHELMLAEPADLGDVLFVDGDAAPAGDLILDWPNAAFDGRKFRGVVVDGNLSIDGNITNANWDGGPFLLVFGKTRVRHILKRGAPIVLLGQLEASGIVYCEYNHGAFRALGGITAEALINDDHLVVLRDPIDAIVFDTCSDDASAFLRDEFYYVEDDGETYLVDNIGTTLITNILAGKPIFRTDAPRQR